MSKNIFKNIFLLVHPFALNLGSFSSLRPFGGGSNLVVRPPYKDFQFIDSKPKNGEEMAISRVGKDLYKMLIKVVIQH